jgi:hypothetical protein
VTLLAETVAESPAPSHARRDRRLPSGVVPALIAVLPFAVALVGVAARHPHIDWSDDRALTELAVREAERGHQLLGLGGRFGWRHPGPAWVYLLLPAYLLSGRASWSLSIGAIALHAVMVVLAVMVLARRGRARAAAVLALLIAGYTKVTGLVFWTNLWAGYAFTWPMLALLVVAAIATAERRSGWAMATVLLLGTLLVQTDVSTALPVVLVAGVAGIVRIRRFGWRLLLAGRAPAHGARVLAHAARGRARKRGRQPGWLLPSRPAMVLLAIVVVAWIPPVVQQLTTSPGNLLLLWRFAWAGAGGHPLRQAAGAVGAALTVLPLGARWVLSARLSTVLGPGPWWGVAVTVAYIVVPLAAAVWAWRHQRGLAGDLCLFGALGVVAAVMSMARVDGPINFYLLTWVSILPVVCLLGVVVAVVPAPVRRADPVAIGALALAAVVTAVTLVTQGGTYNWDQTRSADIAAETRLVLPLDPGGLVRIHIATPITWQNAAGVALQLERHGSRIEVDQSWVFLFGDGFRPRAQTPSVEVWFAGPKEAPVVQSEPGVTLLGRVAGVSVFGRTDLTGQAGGSTSGT